ncbi:MAG: hypothetical protein AAGA32_03445 [Pseudomonadota bacterium]
MRLRAPRAVCGLTLSPTRARDRGLAPGLGARCRFGHRPNPRAGARTAPRAPSTPPLPEIALSPGLQGLRALERVGGIDRQGEAST